MSAAGRWYGARVPHVLVVDDDPTIRALLVQALVDDGHEADAAADGAEALVKVRAREPDMILLDLMMPGMSGADFVRACDADARCRDVPIVILSAAYDLTVQAAELRQLGVRVALAKPFDVDAVLGVVTRYARPRAT